MHKQHGFFRRQINPEPYLSLLNQYQVATEKKVLKTIEQQQRFAKGCGFADIALLALAPISDDTKLWTLDKRLE